MKLRTTIPDTLYSELKTGEYKWTLNEMISGFKYIRDINYQGKYLSLQQAILDSDIVKLDVYVWFAGRYIEMSNFMVIEAITNKGIVPINAQQMPYEKALIEDYHHYRYGVGKEKNVFKSLKRLWSLSVLRKNTKLTNELTPFLDGKWADLYQICADLASVIDITNKYKLEGRIIQHKNVKDRVSQMIELINERLSRLFNQFTFITFSNASFERGAYLNLLNEETDKFLNSVENIDI
ncbi:MAG: hypothetical protein KDH96_09990 [Candidatus Riesia sp.]|nr:hypothetical protein [Candidatus Riesia sp.]